MHSQIVIGLGFGDEGKGRTTDYLCRQAPAPLVVRFSGGQQAGHTVVTAEGKRHVFSSIGAGSFAGAPTYWSRYCSFAPENLWNEWQAFVATQGSKPVLIVDALAQVTTPYDVFQNRAAEKTSPNGSCGMGFGATMERNEITPNRLYVQDLFYPQVLEQKLLAIGEYYRRKTQQPLLLTDLEPLVQQFKAILTQVLPCIEVVQERDFFNRQIQQRGFSHLVFEGSQGILLDRDFGFFPNVTRAYTTSHKAIQLIEHYNLGKPEIYYITRAYQTRHGKGFLSNENLTLDYQRNPIETNQYNEWQGHQRVSPLDLNMLKYALNSDANFSAAARKNLVITCLDQITGPISATLDGQMLKFEEPAKVLEYLPLQAEKLLLSRSDRGELVTSHE
jgi:adenylosuccinate synthase